MLNSRDAKSEIKPKRAEKGLSSFIKRRRDPWKNRDTDSLRSLAKLLGIISLNRKMITVLITEQIMENAKESRNASDLPNRSRKISVARMVNTAAPAILVTLFPRRSVVSALSNLLRMYITPCAFLLPSSASALILILFTAENELSVAAKYAPPKTQIKKMIHKGILSLPIKEINSLPVHFCNVDYYFITYLRVCQAPAVNCRQTKPNRAKKGGTKCIFAFVPLCADSKCDVNRSPLF